ncbi:hypothetical protein CDD82_1537 [Ophiocordyceps australis]|uniref:EXPERA domain-containing protein n=1 Tax=Ophiocordyceps australis TaxID=1399860 RepID=A0A2C5ZL55_9HYPO|nr:hypothetical protein CDD82_1537 [Ophiocordyceps australis]
MAGRPAPEANQIGSKLSSRTAASAIHASNPNHSRFIALFIDTASTMVNTRASLRAESLGLDANETPPPTVSPRKSSRIKRSAARSPSPAATGRKASTATAMKPAVVERAWQHRPTRATLAWLAISLPLVAWDTGYVLLRPHSMAGGWLHWPLWVPYTLYGEVDHVYGWKAWEARNGFTGAQAFLNLVETVLYLGYLWLALRVVQDGGKGSGRMAGLAVLLGFSAAVMTLSKTVLYWMNEYYSGFDNIGHNAFVQLLFLWIIPNGAWLVGSTYMIWSLGSDILKGLEAASKHAKIE